jgi:hypothetical protein
MILQFIRAFAHLLLNLVQILMLVRAARFAVR